ncbi:MAG: hypothetical protein ACXW2E_01135 [Nitrososphaeraceae archaeon]
MTQQLKNYVGFSRDHSGSMRSLAKPAMDDYNKLIEELKNTSEEENIDTIVSVVRCGNGYISAVARETQNSSISALLPIVTYSAQAPGTPLFDSVGELIEMFESTPDVNDPNVSFVVMAVTDGEENDSRRWKRTLPDKIRQLQATDRWTFVFRVPKGYKRSLVRLGIPEGNIQEWELSSKGIEEAAVATSQAFRSFYSNLKTGVKATSSFYTTNLTAVDLNTVRANLVDVSNQVQFWTVDHNYANSQIRDFCEALSGSKMLKGAGFYRLDKKEEVQEHKQIAIRDKTGAVYIGPSARDLMGLPHCGTIKVAPGDHADYTVFVQSTSVNRKLPEGTEVMYWPNIGVKYSEGKSA